MNNEIILYERDNPRLQLFFVDSEELLQLIPEIHDFQIYMCELDRLAQDCEEDLYQCVDGAFFEFARDVIENTDLSTYWIIDEIMVDCMNPAQQDFDFRMMNYEERRDTPPWTV